MLSPGMLRHVALVGTYGILHRIYTIIILTVVLYECETLALTFRDERRLNVFEKKVLRRRFETMRNVVAEVWNEELYKLSSSPGVFRIITLRGMR
jgi:hypothetical protein